MFKGENKSIVEAKEHEFSAKLLVVILAGLADSRHNGSISLQKPNKDNWDISKHSWLYSCRHIDGTI